MTRFGIVLGVQALVACCGAAGAATLDQEACARLKTELMQLELGGTRSSMAKGPEWARVNLPADKLQQIKRLIEIEEQILFRCQGKPLVVLPEGVDGEAPAVADRKEGPAAAAPAKEPPKALPAGKAQGPTSGPPFGQGQAKAPAPPQPKAGGAAAKPAAPAANKTGAAKAVEPPITSAQPKPKPLPAPKAKPKVDDAYQPAPVPPGTDPFSAKP
jgi:hypothetical protein